ncbi:MAG: 5-formyltetrahydrofolate cyclo-ligase [Magnetococcus sp. DMHC-1]|nr:5-formyltetrahydrofolate cyclo-ligase [Magnetococcales bacterium]
MPESKSDLRTRLRKIRRQMNRHEVVSLSRQICARATTLTLYQNARTVGLYVAMDNEVDPSCLLTDALQCNRQVFLPVTNRQEKTLNFVPYRTETPLRKGAYGIPEPAPQADTPTLKTAEGLDLLFLPLVGFDRQGVRLGYGGGFFDRFLEPAPRPLLAGLAYGFQEVTAIPGDALDVRLDVVVTEQEILFLTKPPAS